MSDYELIREPSTPIEAEYRFNLAPRQKHAFNTVLVAGELIDPHGKEPSVAKVDVRPGKEAHRLDMEVAICHNLARGRMEERLICQGTADGLKAHSLERTVTNQGGEVIRDETVRFSDRTIPLPPDAYPETMLPFLLRWQPFDGKERPLHSWTNDRFIARVYYKTTGGPKKLTIGGRKVDAVEMVMYPDFADWVPLGKLLSKLATPFVPKYHLWFSPEAPYHILRYEGPLGPPGAPEVVMELRDPA